MKIQQHSRGNYYTTLTISGKKNFIYGATPEEVETKFIEMKYKHNQGYNVNDNPTMEEYMIKWFNAYKKGVGAIETQNMYRNCVNVHINPTLGHLKVKEITGTQVQTFLNSITSSKSLAHKVRITLNQIFKHAISDRLISFNPVLATKVIATDKPKRACLNDIQRTILIEVLRGHRTFPIIMTILYTGMRMGEALALLWKDIDLDNNIIKVTKATEYDHYKPKQKKTKTERGVRDIPIPDDLAIFLKQYHKTAKKSLYVFPGHKGGPMGLTEMKRIWKKARGIIDKHFKNNEDIKDYSFHLTFRLLRHTYCTALYDAGIDELSAAELMGHDVGIMREVYTHIQSTRRKKTVEKLGTLFKEPELNVIQMKKSK